MNTIKTKTKNTTNRGISAFRTYGLTGQTIMIRSKEENPEYNPWGAQQVPVKITGEYPNFLTAMVLPHKHPVTGRMSESYPVTIHKHDIILQKVVMEYGDRIDYGVGMEKMRGIMTVADLRKAVSEAVGVAETRNMVDPTRWMITEVENSIAFCEKCGIRVEVFPSGFIAASFGNRDTVFQIEDLTDDYRDRYSRRSYKADYFTGLPWEVRLLLEAEDRLGIRVLISDEDQTDDRDDRDDHAGHVDQADQADRVNRVNRVETVKKMFAV